jgi:hypothetical protein
MAHDDSRTTEPGTSIHDADRVDEETHESRTSKLRNDLHAFYTRNFGLCLVFIAQTCGSVVCPHAQLNSQTNESR